jgi:hypothetical protein
MDGQINELVMTNSAFTRKKREKYLGQITRKPHLGNRSISFSRGEMILQPIKSVLKINEYSL